MKPTELMIGDWVLRDGEPLRVVLIDDNLNFKVVATTLNHSYVGKAAGLQPVPLTPEILEKNGLESEDNMFGLKDYKLEDDYILENRGDRFCLVRGLPGYPRSKVWIFDIRYVHELQHALRLAGINKEIEL